MSPHHALQSHPSCIAAIIAQPRCGLKPQGQRPFRIWAPDSYMVSPMLSQCGFRILKILSWHFFCRTKPVPAQHILHPQSQVDKSGSLEFDSPPFPPKTEAWSFPLDGLVVDSRSTGCHRHHRRTCHFQKSNKLRLVAKSKQSSHGGDTIKQ